MKAMPTNPDTTETKTAIATAAAPSAIGPYTQAVRAGETIFTSGQLGIDPKTGDFVPGGVREQTRQALENLKAILEAGGATLAHVVKTSVFLNDMNDFAAMNEVYATYLAPSGTVPPARSTVEVARLPKDALVEIDVIARHA